MSDEISRDVFFKDLMEAFASVEAYHDDQVALRVSEVSDAGRRRIFMETGSTTRARHAIQKRYILATRPRVGRLMAFINGRIQRAFIEANKPTLTLKVISHATGLPEQIVRRHITEHEERFIFQRSSGSVRLIVSTQNTRKKNRKLSLAKVVSEKKYRVSEG